MLMDRMKALMPSEEQSRPTILFVHKFLSHLPADIGVHYVPFAVTGSLAELARCADMQFLSQPAVQAQLFMADAMQEERPEEFDLGGFPTAKILARSTERLPDLLLLPPGSSGLGTKSACASGLAASPQEMRTPAKISQFCQPPCHFSSVSVIIFTILFTVVFSVSFAVSVDIVFNCKSVKSALGWPPLHPQHVVAQAVPC